MNNKIITKDLKRTIIKARKAGKNGKEICGLLIYNGHFLEILETKNISKKLGHFEFNGKQIRTIMKAVKTLGHEIVGTFHSHPAYYAKPGDGDINSAVDDSLMLIIACIANEAKLWRIRSHKAREIKYKIIEV